MSIGRERRGDTQIIKIEIIRKKIRYEKEEETLHDIYNLRVP